jgi:catechol 2,3-dioxygenase-like lactoylglutathione lyase family enzyme
VAKGSAFNPATSFAGVHHIGVSVANLDDALAFWEKFLGKPARWSTVLDRPYLSRVVGYPDVSIRAAFVDLPDGRIIELLDYHRVEDRRSNSDATANPGNVHLCLLVDDADAAWVHAVLCGARAISPEGPVEVDGGPNKGAKTAYFRIHDGVTLEVFQPPAAVEQRR